MNVSRIPRLAVVSWVIATATIAGLAAAVWHYLATESSGTAGMHGMSMGTADAFSRGGSRGSLRPLTFTTFFTQWQLDSIALAVLVLTAALYLTGVALASSRGSGGGWPLRRTASFLGGLLVCAFATNGSVAVYDQVLFTMHMIGHLLLVMVAPALLVWGRPLSLALAAAPPRRRARLTRVLQSRVTSVLTAPPVVLAVYAVVIVGSHLTGLMDTIMRNTWAGQVEHLVYVLAGGLFFIVIVGDEPIRWKLGSPARWLLLAVAMAVDTFVGIILMQGTQAVSLLPSNLSVNALSDTHTGGAIMWFGGDAIMAAIMIGLVVAWLRTVDEAPADQGWLEQARLATFSSHTGSSDESSAPMDEDDAAHAAYNNWLAKLGNNR